MTPQFQTTWLNKTPHKWTRTAIYKPEFVVAHETAGYGTLQWNLRPEAQASFNYLILRNGVIHRYVDETRYIAWHAGLGAPGWVNNVYYGGHSRWKIGTVDYYKRVNICAIGVEFEGPNNGQPITDAQKRAFIELAIYFRDTYNIPIHPDYYPEHKDVAPGYKHDGMGYDIKELIRMTLDAIRATESDDRRVIGVPPSATPKQIIDSLTRNAAPFTADEMKRIPILMQWNDIDPAYAVAVMKKESEFGKNPLQRKTNNLFNIKAETGDDRARYTDEKGRTWLVYESPWIALQDWVVHMKQEYGAKGLHTVRDITYTYAPPIENDTEKYIRDVLTTIKYIQDH